MVLGSTDQPRLMCPVESPCCVLSPPERQVATAGFHLPSGMVLHLLGLDDCPRCLGKALHQDACINATY